MSPPEDTADGMLPPHHRAGPIDVGGGGGVRCRSVSADLCVPIPQQQQQQQRRRRRLVRRRPVDAGGDFAAPPKL